MSKKSKKIKLDSSVTKSDETMKVSPSKNDNPSPQKYEDWKEWRIEKKRLHKERKEKKLLKVAEIEIKNKETSIETEKRDIEVKIISESFYTLSIALPGSILDNAQSPELRTYLGGQIARAAAIFCVNEIVIFDETSSATLADKTTEGEYNGIGKKGHANVQLARILQYLECPQYLRKSFFPKHKDLEYAGLLNPLDTPHHLRMEDECLYREGIISNHSVAENDCSLANVGLKKEVHIDKAILPGVRVTVQLDLQKGAKKLTGNVISPSAPQSEGGIYWGYTVRLASTFGEVFNDGPHKNGYDLIIGTSERGDDSDSLTFKKAKHIMVVFGGLKGLEYCLESDQSLESEDLRKVFHHYVNSCPGQGSRTIRTEEAILITLSTLKPKFVLKKTEEFMK